MSKARVAEPELLAATPFKDFPLSARDASWDGSAADGRVRKWASSDGSGDKEKIDWTKYRSAFFWADPGVEDFGGTKLGFADIVGGRPTAIWNAVNAAAGAVQGARGGVKIPSGDVAGVKNHIGRYYSKASTTYKDPAITPPWESSVAAETVAVDELEAALVAAAPGEIVWAGEDGMRDLLDDVDDLLEQYAGEFCAKDVTRQLDRVLISDDDDDDHYVAAIVVDAATGGVTSLAPQAEWIEVDTAWVAETETETEPPDSSLVADEEQAVAALEQKFAVSEPPPLTAATTDVADAIAAAVVERLTTGNASTLAAPVAAPEATLPAPVPPAVPGKKWEAVLLVEGEQTDDGRMFADGSVSWRDLPIPLMGMTETQDGHDGAQVAGRVDRIWRDGSTIRAEGVFDTGEYGEEIGRLVGEGTLRGVSVDVAVREREFVYPEGEQVEGGSDDEDLIGLLLNENSIMSVTDGVIGAVTVCPFPAFGNTSITLVASGCVFRAGQQAGWIVVDALIDRDGDLATAAAALVAAAVEAPTKPPVEWFDDPKLDELTPLIVLDDGRVFGHVAPWGTCHIGIPGVCTTAPRSTHGYGYFHMGSVETDDGPIGAGKITLGTGHADSRLGYRGSSAHYDNTGAVVADVRAGEDDHGIWVAGALRPDVDEETLRTLRAAPLSGDWRRIDGNLEMVAVLAVNVPGFPVPRPKALVATAGPEPVMLSLTAIGIHDGAAWENVGETEEVSAVEEGEG